MRHAAIPVPQGALPDLPPGCELPPATAAALERARGALVRTLYVAAEGGRTAALLGIHRPLAAQEKLTGFGGDAALEDGLVAFARAEARRAGAVSVRAEAPHAVPPASWYRQTTEFTCGPAALMMALAARGLAGPPTLDEELRIWREATTVLATDPFGLALAARRRGAQPEVVVSAASVLARGHPLAVLDLGAAQALEAAYRAEARAAGIPSETRAFDAADLAERVGGGQAVVLLIDELLMHGESCPHWIALTGFAGGVFFAEDPWTDREFGETWADAHHLALPASSLDRLMRTGDPPVQALVAL